MRKDLFFHRIRYILMLIVMSYASINTANCGELSNLKDIVVSHLNLINQVIDDPKAANMNSWNVLGNPHDESELKFYMNSISNGTSSAYNEKEKTMQKLVEHSRSISDDEPSILLQYLRLSLMAYNIRPGSTPPSFQLISLSQSKQNEIVAKCNFRVVNASGVTVNKKTEIYFDIGDNPRSDLFLQKITIDGRVAFGGW